MQFLLIVIYEKILYFVSKCKLKKMLLVIGRLNSKVGKVYIQGRGEWNVLLAILQIKATTKNKLL